MPSRYDDGKPVRLSFTYDWPIWKAKAAWISIDNPKEMHKMPGFDYKMMSMWSNVSNDFLFVYRKDSLSLGQIAKADAITGKITILTNDEGEKDDPGMFISPEYNNEILLIANVNNSELGIFRDLKSEDSSWTRIATIRLPDSIPYKFISSPEVITPSTGINGISYFSLLAREGKDRTTPGGIWIVSLGLDSNTRLYRRIDDGAITDLKAIRIEPEPFAGKNEVFVYYNYYEMKTGQSGLRRARTGLNISITNIHSKNVLKPEISIISPNPASDYIEINADNVILNGAKNLVKIYNTYGECVMEMQDVGHLGDVGHLNRIDISHLPFGFYFIRIGNYSQKFMVIR
jgi:hypothetical protein